MSVAMDDAPLITDYNEDINFSQLVSIKTRLWIVVRAGDGDGAGVSRVTEAPRYIWSQPPSVSRIVHCHQGMEKNWR